MTICFIEYIQKRTRWRERAGKISWEMMRPKNKTLSLLRPPQHTYTDTFSLFGFGLWTHFHLCVAVGLVVRVFAYSERHTSNFSILHKASPEVCVPKVYECLCVYLLFSLQLMNNRYSINRNSITFDGEKRNLLRSKFLSKNENFSAVTHTKADRKTCERQRAAGEGKLFTSVAKKINENALLYVGCVHHHSLS